MDVAILVLCGVCGTLAFREWNKQGKRWWVGLGFGPDRAPLEFLTGLAIGALVMAGVYAVFLTLNLLRFTGAAPEGEGWLVAIPDLLGLALIEEIVFRGLLLSGLIVLLKRPWLAVTISAALFGLAHAANPGATPLSVISNALGGVMYALPYLGTRRIWLPWGLHFAWNYFQGPVFGFLVSGLALGGLIHQVSVGDPLLTGGSYGPEGGLIAIAFRGVVMLAVVLVIRYAGSRGEVVAAG